MGVSTHSRPKAAATALDAAYALAPFQHTAARRRLPGRPVYQADLRRFNTQPPEGGCCHSRNLEMPLGCFNTQPPEGGCRMGRRQNAAGSGFNTQPPEGGCDELHGCASGNAVSTHSRPKAAASQ